MFNWINVSMTNYQMERNKQERGHKVLIKEGWYHGTKETEGGKKALEEHKLILCQGTLC